MRCLVCHREDVPDDAILCPGCGTDLRQVERDILPPGTQLREGSYRLEQALGRGGFGITYRAVHTDLDTVLAIKEYFPGGQVHRQDANSDVWVVPDQASSFERGMRRFYREGQLLAQLTHPNIVRVTDLFQERGTAYLVMEFLSGPTLRQAMEQAPDHRLAPERVEALVGSLVQALATLHARKIYHLDISPENILLVRNQPVDR